MTLTTRRGFIRKGAVAAAALPAIASTLSACSETKADNAAGQADATCPSGTDATAEGRPDGRDAREGCEGVPREDRRSGQPAPEAAGREGCQGVRSRGGRDPVGGRARPQGEGLGLQRPGARPADPGARGRPRAGQPDQQAPRVHRDPLPRARAAERSGRRAVHHPASGQAGRQLHLRIHGAQRRLAHVPLAPQRRDAGRPGAARRVHRRAQAVRCRRTGPRWTT